MAPQNAMENSENLSDGDSQVLSYIFDPEGALAPGIVTDPALPSDVCIKDSAVLSRLRARELEAIRLVEVLNRQSDKVDEEAKHSAFVEASRLFSILIEEHPEYASAYNNRAQVTRWRYGDDILVEGYNTSPSDSMGSVLETVIDDLNNAIRLATPASPSDAVSPSQAKLLAQAHTQRATLFYAKSKHAKGREAKSSSFRPLEGYGAEDLEDACATDFFLGGRYGNDISKAMAVHTNPYAKMCGSIVREAMQRELSPGLRAEAL